MEKWSWVIFVIATAICWGGYVPTLHEGQMSIGQTKGPLRAFLCVGVAYFGIAVILPLILMARGSEPWEFQSRGVMFAIVGGALGALGAFGIIMALKSGGSPIYVAPLVFGLAPIVNVIISLLWHPPKSAPGPLFFAGILLAAAGTALVLRFKPN